MVQQLPEVPAIDFAGNADCGLDCGVSTLCGKDGAVEEGVWLTIRMGGENKTVFAKTVHAIQFAQRILRSADAT